MEANQTSYVDDGDGPSNENLPRAVAAADIEEVVQDEVKRAVQQALIEKCLGASEFSATTCNSASKTNYCGIRKQ